MDWSSLSKTVLPSIGEVKGRQIQQLLRPSTFSFFQKCSILDKALLLQFFGYIMSVVVFFGKVRCIFPKEIKYSVQLDWKSSLHLPLPE